MGPYWDQGDKKKEQLCLPLELYTYPYMLSTRANKDRVGVRRKKDEENEGERVIKKEGGGGEKYQELGPIEEPYLVFVFVFCFACACI